MSKTNQKALLVVYLLVFMDLVGFGIIIPLLPFYMDELGTTALMATSLLGIYSFLQFIFSPILGKISDRIGRRPVLLFSLFGSIIAYGIYALSFLVSPTKGVTIFLIFLSRVLAGIMGANISTAHAFISDIVPKNKRTDAMGKIGAAYGLGFILGPAIGALTNPFGNHIPGLIASVICAIAFFIGYFVLPESNTERKSAVDDNKKTPITSVLTKEVLIITLIIFFFSVAFVQMESIFSLFAKDRFILNQTQIGWIFVLLGIVIVISQGWLIGKISCHCKDISLLVTGLIVLCIGFVGVALSNSVAGMVIFMVVIALGVGTINPSIPSILSKLSGPEHQGLIQGIGQSSASIARVIGPILSGVLYDSYSPQMPFFTGAVILIFCFIFSFYFLKNKNYNLMTAEANI